MSGVLAQSIQTGSSDELSSLISRRQTDAAEQAIVARMMADPRNPALLTLLAEVRLDQERAPEALQLLGNAQELAGRTALRAHLTGLAEAAIGRLQLAEQSFRAAIQLAPDNAASHYFLARILYTRNKFEEAISESKAAIALAPGFVRAYDNLGLCYEGKQELGQAEHWYLEAIRRETSDTTTEWPLLDLATMLIHEERVEDAGPYLKQALDINPHNAHSVFQMGVLLEKSGDSPGALDQFRKAMNLDPNLKGPYYHAARICRKNGDFQQAEKYFARFKQAPDERRGMN